MNEIEQLKAENERLKEEKENLIEQLVIYNQFENSYNKYRQTLQEIKAIVCGNYEIIDPQGRKDILRLITKAEEE